MKENHNIKDLSKRFFNYLEFIPVKSDTKIEIEKLSEKLDIEPQNIVEEAIDLLKKGKR